MGCWASRPDETDLVALCRSRQALIREAADRRYALAAAHSAYFIAVAAVADALLSYAKEALPPPSLVVTLPSSGKSTESSATPLSHSLSDDGSASGSHLHLSDDSKEETEAGSGKGGDPTPQPQFSPAWPSPSYYYMRSSTAIPTMVYGDPYGGYPFSFPGRSVDDPDFYYGRPASPPPTARVSPPPPPSPPPPQGSAWDFFDPFSSYEQFMPVYSSVQYGTASVGSSPSSSEVRTREGIPDLEEVTEPEPLTRVKKGKTVAEDIGAKDSGIGSSKNVAAKEMDELEEKESRLSSGEKASKASSTEKGSQGSSAMSVGGSSGDQGSSSKKKGVSFEDGSSLVSEKSGPSGGGLSEGPRDVVEVLGEIKQEFQSAIVGSMEVSKLLEVWRMPYRPRNKVFKVISSRILGIVGFRFRLPTRRLFKHRHHFKVTTTKSRSTSVEFENHINMKSGNLSSTLEKLHVWEKKLYGEVKAEERLRAIYDKKCKRLKSLDDRGAEPHKINATRVSVRALQTKISIAITSVDVISRRIHMIRDEELHPQLVELIQGLLKMWKTLLGCHHNQLHAIIASKIDNLTIKTAVQDSVTKATMDLKLGLLNWYASFDEWINTQKFFVSALNGWLMKWLPEGREETPDGVAPFSPNRIGAPPVFALSNDWFQVTNRSSETEVKAAIQNFAAKMHKLWLCQDEERQQNQKADSLSQEYSIKLKNLQKEHENRSTQNSDHAAALDTMKKTLDEVRAKHDETVRQVQELGSISLKTDLAPICQSLDKFYTETLQAYEGIRIPNNGGSN